LFDASFFVSVGSNDPDPVALVRRSGMVRAQHSPPRIEPHLGQVSENSIEAPAGEEWRVLHEHVVRSYLANDSGHLAPESGLLAVESGAGSSAGDVLAREATRDEIHRSTPGSAAKSSNVVPDRERWEVAVPLPGEEDASAVRVDLNGADRPPSEEVPCEESATSSGK
jgi:hypothetical protein